MILYTEYKEARKVLKIKIGDSKKGCWNLLCKQVNVDPWGLPYRLVTKKLMGSRPIPGLSLPGRLENIVDTLFPQQEKTPWPNVDGDMTFPEVTEEEIRMLANKIPSGKAPGPDRIPDLVIKELAKCRPDIMGKVFNLCFRDGFFPGRWKLAKQVLLRKGSKPLEQPSKYRSICLLNSAGKFFERVIKYRLEKHLEDIGGLSDRQFDFRKGKSTVGATSRAMGVVEAKSTGLLYKRELYMLVALDVANAFNTVNWRKIIEALKKRKVPRYL